MAEIREFIVPFTDRMAIEKFERIHGTSGEIVRCKNCKWWKLSEYNTYGIHVCQKFSGVRGEYDFCSRGEMIEKN